MNQERVEYNSSSVKSNGKRYGAFTIFMLVVSAILIILKAVGLSQLSWFWTLFPVFLWVAPTAIALSIVLIMLLVAFLYWAIKLLVIYIKGKKYKKEREKREKERGRKNVN